jgi:septal ring factor EnvC (AmiA/AmiB activator)
MSRLAVLLVLALGVAMAGPAHAQGVVTLWHCKDKDGRIVLTSQKEDTVGKECRVVSQERVTVVPTAKPAARSASPAGFPRETPSDRAASKAKQKDTLQQELSQEEAMLADARKKLSEQEAIRTGDEKNYAKVVERLKPYKDTVEVHEKNVEALKRELANLSR